MVGREFSYGDVYKEHRELQEFRADRDSSDHIVMDNRSLTEKIDLEMKGNLINGISLTIIGTLLMLIHFLGRRWVETVDEHSDLLRRLYLIAGLAVFAVVTIVSMIAGIPETLRYALLELEPGRESPGQALSIAIIGVPIWLSYIILLCQQYRSVVSLGSLPPSIHPIPRLCDFFESLYCLNVFVRSIEWCPGRTYGYCISP